MIRASTARKGPSSNRTNLNNVHVNHDSLCLIAKIWEPIRIAWWSSRMVALAFLAA